jgi:2'-hydroxyisoflavone reductase
MSSRREFLRTGALAGGAILAGCARGGRIPDGLAAAPRSQTPLRILVLGGTGFIGPHLVRRAVSRGHQVSIFTRGRRDAEIPDAVERLVGDRAITDANPQGDLRALAGRRWDFVFDDSATDPRWVTASTTALKDSGRYLFVSSTGVFLPYLTANNDETGPILYDPAEGSQPEYGHNKARSERVTLGAFGDRGLVVRPGYIVGPGDTTDRFSYWPQRFAKGGEILVPGKKTDPSQFIDVRDLTEFMVKLAEDQRGGVYNVTGPREPLQWEQFINQAHAALNPGATLVWADDYEFLRSQRITYAIPWMIPEGNNAYHLRINNRKAVGAGLTFRSIADTVRTTLEYWPTRMAMFAQGQGPNWRITAEREPQVIAAWRARGG